MTPLQKFIYAISLAFWDACFDRLSERGAVIEEVVNEADRTLTRRLRVLARKLQDGPPTGPVGGAPPKP